VAPEKLLADMDKISSIKALEALPAQHHASGPVETTNDALYNEYFAHAQRFGFVFATDATVSLKALANHVAEKNLAARMRLWRVSSS
jgi:hypothetical protein